jgi:hypothetical protein
VQASYAQQDIEKLANIYELLADTAERIQSIGHGILAKPAETLRS